MSHIILINYELPWLQSNVLKKNTRRIKQLFIKIFPKNMNHLNKESTSVSAEESDEPLDSTDLHLYGFVDKYKLKNNKPNAITLKIIIKRNLKINNKVEGSRKLPRIRDVDEGDEEGYDDEENYENYQDTAELKASQLLKLTHIHLDREQIGEIDNLAECLGDVTNLYLQHNLIKRIENLEFLRKLKFLCLANNQIRLVENLNMLENLKLLDLSSNLIEEVANVNELPKNLISLDLRDNACLLGKSWTETSAQIHSHLKHLSQFNGQSRYETNETLSGPISASEPVEEFTESAFEKRREQIVARSRQRQKNDIEYIDRISQQRRIQLDEARRSISDHFKN